MDSLGYRLKLGIVAPSTNTSVQPEMDDMRPAGVTNHFARALIPDNPIKSDADFEQLMVDIRASMEAAVGSVITSDPTASSWECLRKRFGTASRARPPWNKGCARLPAAAP